VSVPDAATVPLMLSYHEGLRAGRAPADALASAQVRFSTTDSAQWAAAAAFICLGAD
jgi:CHAT domain-containing protein